jgi:hypothetical protein
MSHNTVCAVKLILIIALRLGHVESPTLDGVLRNAAQRADGTIKWTKPDAPVLSQMRKGLSPFLVLELPAGQEQIRYSLQEMAWESGMLEKRIDTRALRRGALRDHAYNKKAIAGVPSLDTAMLANHSNVSYNMGTTRDYVGPLETASYNLRSENQRADRMAPAFAEEGPSKEWRRRFTKAETDEYMKTHDLDPNDPQKRRVAGRHMKNERRTQWREQAKDQPLRQRTASEVNLPVVKGANAPKNFPAPVAPVAPLLTDDVVDNDDDDMIDPQLRKYGLPVHSTMSSLMDAILLQGEASGSKYDDNVPDDSDAVRTDTADDVDIAMQDAVALENATAAGPTSAILSPSQGVQLADVEILSGDDFVRFFSQINIYQSNNASFDRNDLEEVKKHTPCGNSRDAPTPWLYYCEKGCGYSTFSEHYLQEHELNCNGQAREKPCPCPRRGCDKSFKNEATMKTHVANDHDFTPKACDQCPDQPNVLYTTKNQLHNHREKVHNDPIEETDCPLVAGCKSALKFTSKKALKKHLKSKAHGLTTDQLKEYVRDARLDHKQKPGRKNKPKGWHLEQSVDEQDDEE